MLKSIWKNVILEDRHQAENPDKIGLFKEDQNINSLKIKSTSYFSKTQQTKEYLKYWEELQKKISDNSD